MMKPKSEAVEFLRSVVGKYLAANIRRYTHTTINGEQGQNAFGSYVDQIARQTSAFRIALSTLVLSKMAMTLAVTCR